MIPKFKIRCSAIGSIMAGSVGLTVPQQRKLDKYSKQISEGKPLTDTQAKDNKNLIESRDNPQLPAGSKTYCLSWLKEQIYDRRKEFSSKYTDKGNLVEDLSIEFMNEYFAWVDGAEDFTSMKKNEEFFQNDFMQGTPDVTPGKEWVVDAKNSWSFDTFPLFDTKPDKGYWLQLQGYMKLTGRTKARLIYCLMNAPRELIEDEARRASYKSEQTIEELIEYYTEQLCYDDVDTELRIQWFDFELDNDAINRIEERVKMCQVFIDQEMKRLKERKR